MTYWKVLLAVFGVVPVLILLFAKQHMLLVFSFFVLVLLLRPFLKPAIERVPFGLLSKFVFVGLVFGLIAEGLAILDNLSLPSEQMQLFHSDVFLDLAIGVGFYAFWAVVWYFLLKKYVFKTLDVFVLGGLWSVVVEQNGAIFLSVFSAGLFGCPPQKPAGNGDTEAVVEEEAVEEVEAPATEPEEAPDDQGEQPQQETQ
ncbi:MAG: hypothetical protein ACE5DI_06465 [Candidatus Micrarchaeia archaeon]